MRRSSRTHTEALFDTVCASYLAYYYCFIVFIVVLHFRYIDSSRVRKLDRIDRFRHASVRCKTVHNHNYLLYQNVNKWWYKRLLWTVFQRTGVRLDRSDRICGRDYC